jgi:hypothetical protein
VNQGCKKFATATTTTIKIEIKLIKRQKIKINATEK